MPIILPPSDSTEALVDAIHEALLPAADGILNLKPGIHYTRKYVGVPSENNVIEVSDKILQIKTKPWGSRRATIKRPDYAINPEHPDDNYGLFFVPARPGEDEINSITEWRRSYNSKFAIFDYAVFILGEIHVSNINIDCNIPNQGLEAIYENAPEDNKAPAEHSCMIGFRGAKYTVDTNIDEVPKVIYVGFRKVTINNVDIINGGYADDIWISRGYFNPNIESVKMSNIIAKRENRHNGKRSSIDISGLTKNFKANDLNIYSLQAEPDNKSWEELPGSVEGEKYCNWQLTNITTEILDLTSPRKSLYLDGRNLTVSKSCPLSEIAGSILNSNLTKSFKSPKLTRLDHFLFKNVNWLILQDTDDPDPNDMVRGIVIDADEGDSCEIEFVNNKFEVEGVFANPASPKKYFLIKSDHSVCRKVEYEAIETVCDKTLEDIEDCLKREKLNLGDYKNSCLNKVDIRFINCEFDSDFGSDTFPDTWIARPFERGKWYFSSLDGRTRDRALYETGLQSDVIVTVD